MCACVPAWMHARVFLLCSLACISNVVGKCLCAFLFASCSYCICVFYVSASAYKCLYMCLYMCVCVCLSESVCVCECVCVCACVHLFVGGRACMGA